MTRETNALFLLLVTVLGSELCSVTVGSAQTVAPSQQPSQPIAPQQAQPPAQEQPPNAAPLPDQVAPAAEQTKREPRKLDKAALEEAKHAYATGEKAYQSGDYKSAIQNFQGAQAILPSAQAGYWLALSLKADGQVPEAIAEFKALLGSPAADKLGPEKLAVANAALEELNKTPGMITLSTEPAGATISVDGEVRQGQSPLAVELTPGAHTLTVSLQGYQSMELELEVPPGSKGEQQFGLIALPPPPTPVAGAPAPASQTRNVVLRPAGTAPKKASKLGMYVVYGLAGASAITGTVFGILALGDKSDFNKAPSDAAADRVTRDATIADVGFGAAITFGLAGIVMSLATEELPAGREKSTAAGTSRRRQFAISPYGNRDGAGVRAGWQF